MEKNDTVLLREIEETLAALKQRLQEVEAQLLALKAAAPDAIVPEEFVPEAAVPEIVVPEEAIAGAAAPEAIVPEEAIHDDAVVEEDTEEAVEFTVDLTPEPLPPLEAPEGAPLAVPEKAPAPAPVIPEDVARLRWRTARPGAPVKHIRSGISLLDRAQFVGSLFKEDVDLYNRTLAELDELSSLDEATDYILRHFPDWNLQSDLVFSFMMAVRKRLG